MYDAALRHHLFVATKLISSGSATDYSRCVQLIHAAFNKFPPNWLGWLGEVV
jgi:hypothetical protein